ncbi:N-terminal domain of galactosyltransferase [bacterium A37T11]|nr:N-terminal domain of galactosyltransferase [bacterium A37T11]
MMNLNVSLVISTYNWPEALDLCLKSVMEQHQLPDEVVIADDGSDDRTLAIIQKYQKNVPIPLKHIWHSDEGFRKSLILNKAVKEANCEYIVQIDGDVILDVNFIKDHVGIAEKSAFVRGTRAHLGREQLTTVFGNGQIKFNFYSKGVFNRFNAVRIPSLSWIMTKKSFSSKSVRGSNLAYWKDDFILVNGYNNDLQGWGHEDEELAARFINNGVIKKAVKFKAVQYHLFHNPESRKHEHFHKKWVEKTLSECIKKCVNGYNRIHETQEEVILAPVVLK